MVASALEFAGKGFHVEGPVDEKDLPFKAPARSEIFECGIIRVTTEYQPVG